MAQQQPQTVPEDIFTRVGKSDETIRAITVASSRLDIATRARTDVDVLEEGYVDVDFIDSLLVTHLNGIEGLPEQRVTVEYLKGNQRMVIPAMLAMSWDGAPNNWTSINRKLHERYHKLTTQTYAQLKTLCKLGQPLSETTKAIDAIAMPAAPAEGRVQYMRWLENAYYTATEPLSHNEILTTFAFISSAAQMNADVRDYGMLLCDELVKTDDAWKKAEDATHLTCYLKAYTLQNIAALNYERVGSLPIAAWVRAYGLGVGIMPSRNSKTVIEYGFSTRMPSHAEVKAVALWHKEYQRNMMEVCCNILAMFGLFHLNKDHTHRTNDATMIRIQKSYIGAIRTAATDNLNETMIARAEEITRTAPHPFGLAQTYWLAIAMGHLGKLAAPLALRVNACPPPVQRLLMVNAMLKEWASLPAGQVLNNAFANEFTTVVKEVEKVRKNPPAYSGLYRLYAIEKMETLSPEAQEAVAALIPPIYGYVMITHVTTTMVKSGAALAQSWTNIEREQNAVLDGWRNLWSRYFESMESLDMVTFAVKTREATQQYQQALEASKEPRE